MHSDETSGLQAKMVNLHGTNRQYWKKNNVYKIQTEYLSRRTGSERSIRKLNVMAVRCEKIKIKKSSL